MLPSILAKQLQRGLTEYIDTTFPITNSVFRDSLKNMVETKDAVFHEPYIAVRLPFRVYEGENNIFQAIHQSHSPYVHQQKAFERLTGEDGRSTLVATGTGSGKTECFLYPILEHCYRHRGEKGIKALIIYPMNALASDQAKRIAELVDGSEELKNNGIRVGMYVGGQEKNSTKIMMSDRVITDHETLLATPPDILLTNYKMLDYLLVRPKDAELWKHNSNPETLKYIAVDELHTFDGAQGTDLACLLRRLKSRLNIMQGHLCCIGTSATMGAKESAENIRKYAVDVFGEIFEPDSVITEDRLTASEFFENCDIIDYKLPISDNTEELERLSNEENEEAYLKKAVESWFDESFAVYDIMSDDAKVKIGQHLMVHNFIQDMLSESKGSYMQSTYLIDSLRLRFPELVEMKSAEAAIDALYALISHARILDAKGKVRPFLNVQVQVWMRELRRLMANVADKDIKFALASDLNEQQSKHYLPVVNCRDCGETGWTSLIDEQGNMTLADLTTFYNLFFRGDSKVRFIFPHKPEETLPFIKMQICPECLDVDFADGKHQVCQNGHRTIPVWIPELDVTSNGNRKQYTCPFCGSHGGLSIMGLRSATAISAGISQIYASKFNDDKKLLAFSDNVQDAAHRAGFFNSRTWRFGLRSAIQRFAMLETAEISMQEFAIRCVDYWINYYGEESFIATFIAPNMTWMSAYEHMRRDGVLKKDSDGEALLDNISRRMEYEVFLEYGLSARIGRSLEKSGCSVAHFDLGKSVNIIMERVHNEVGILRTEDVDIFSKIILGFLYGMKINGAFQRNIYNTFIREGGKSYLLSNDKMKWLPGMHIGRNVPKFIAINSSDKKIGSFDMIDVKSWYGKWIEKYLPVMKQENWVFDVGRIILEELESDNVLIECEGPKNVKVWAINTGKAIISKNVKQMVCDKCGSKISVSEMNSKIWQDAFCTRIGCEGHFHVQKGAGLDYYGKLYSQGDLVRIFAKEHTGLLERDDREELERTFKRANEDRNPWDTNLLSCTPTLEMGIDIGDLSTVILCSIPPSQAQYAQRAGRGGRKDGNALTIAVANARPHDLYFYAEPMEMIAGIVEPPKIFLRASAVLSRQFVAYCMDCWVKSGAGINAIPRNVGACLAKLAEKPKNFFPFNFLNYVQNNMTKLHRMFIQTFSGKPGHNEELDTDTIEELRKFAKGDGLGSSPMHMMILEAFEGLKNQKSVLQKNIKELRNMMKEIEAKPKDSSYDEKLKDLRSECMALLNVVHSINNKDVFNFLSDEGLLPNYAFPEAGIVLKAVLYRSEETVPVEGKRKYEKLVYEYSRSAASAISEFAPLNSFYVDGRKLRVDQVDLTTAQSVKWRLCPNCSHAQLEEVGKNIMNCPKCGSSGWADAGQVRSMLKVQMVYSNMKYKDSLIGDESDDRSSTFYRKEMLVDVDEDKDILKAYSMNNDEFPFGYEFVQKATIREINFGEKDIVGDKFTVAGVEGIRKGFTICKYCGKIQDGKKAAHTMFCKMKKENAYLHGPFEECLFLYREFQTEIIRLLIPATTMDSSKVRLESFVAAFMLGMKSYFGNVDHLRACVSEVPVQDADYRKQYLVIYDSVPGGTGYLKQLMNSSGDMTEILERALNVMESCFCKADYPQKDGCYRCLYAYRQSQHIGEISRATAMSLLKTILRGKENIEEIPKLGNVQINSLFESELERRFIEAIARLGKENRKVEIHKKLVNEKDGYSLQVGECLWEIELQVTLDETEGIMVKSRADFVLRPKRTTGNQKPVVIFTDGFQYHKDKVADDSLKRMAILETGKYRVWTLSWRDVQQIFQLQGDYSTNTLMPDHMPTGSKMYRPTVKAANAEEIKPDKENAFELLMDYLANPNAEYLFNVHATAYSLSIIDVSKMNNKVLYDEWKKTWNYIYANMDIVEDIDNFGEAIFGIWKPRNNQGNLEILAEAAMKDMPLKMKAPISVMAILYDNKDTRSDKYDADWNGYWHFVNIMQFNKHMKFVSETGLDNAIYTILHSAPSTIAVFESQPVINSEWIGIMDEFIDDIAKTCANDMMQKHIPIPTVIGFELEDETTGAGIAEAEMAWENLKIVWLLPEQEDFEDVFKSKGWKVIMSNDKVESMMFGGGLHE